MSSNLLFHLGTKTPNKKDWFIKLEQLSFKPLLERRTARAMHSALETLCQPESAPLD